MGDHWESVEDAARETAGAASIDEYRKLRRTVQANAADQLKLAHWCARHGLPAQERVHLLFALYYAPNLTDAVRKLGLTRYRGAFMSPAQADAAQRAEKELAVAQQTWKPRLTQWRRDIEGTDASKYRMARQALQSVPDPRAISMLEEYAKISVPAFGEAVVASLSKIPGQRATDSLARHAVFADGLQVRQAASEALKSRSLYSYVPTMMYSLEPPAEVQSEQTYMNGQFVHRLRLFQHGMLADQELDSAGGTSEDVIFSRRYGNSDNLIPDRTYGRDAMIAQHQIYANATRVQNNERIAAALQTATGNNLPPEPEKWWDWWFNYNDMYRPPQQVYHQTYSSVPRPFRIRYMSCFVAGTKVMTATGPMPIEQIEVGECVLAQDVETGELAYKPVIGTTVRPPSPLVNIEAGGETIHATRGHPFWVSGVGWQMAKELKAGQLLHTPHGPLPIDTISEGGAESCHNLIVADFGTYFVTDQQVLVHDNNLRQVTNATVPGLTAASPAL